MASHEHPEHLPDPAAPPVDGIRALRRVEDAVRRVAGRRATTPETASAVPAAEAAAEARVEAPEETDAEPVEEPGGDLRRVARRVALGTLVALGIVVLALALWKVRIIVALLFLAFTIAAALRPGVDALARRRVPRSAGVLLHYALFAGLVALVLWLVIPLAIDQVQGALGDQHTIGKAAQRSTGFKHDLLEALDRRLRKLPSASELAEPAVEYGRMAFEIVIGIFFTFASAAYWILERDRAVDLVCSVVPRPKRKTVRDTWNLIDLKLGAFVRGQLLLILFVGAVLSGAFWAIGLPYWLLVGVFGGLVEIVPVVGPMAAGFVAGAVGLTESFHLALLAGAVVLGVRLLEDYLVIPRLMGHSVGLSPLVVLVSVTTVGILFGGFAVILSIPIASVIGTLVDVAVRARDPAKEHVPAVIFPAKDAE
jgi:predicted PurR-regulated permease PerM